MDIGIIIALIGASITIVGWFVNHNLTASLERKRRRLNAQVEFRNRQLEELYGPLVFLVLEGRRSFEDLLDILGRRHVFAIGDSRLPEDELKTWLFWVDNEFLPRNKKVRELIAEKAHLIEGPQIPESWLRFADHYNSWRVRHDRWKKEGVEYSWTSAINWPRDFEEDVISTFKLLKQSQSELMQQLA